MAIPELPEPLAAATAAATVLGAEVFSPVDLRSDALAALVGLPRLIFNLIGGGAGGVLWEEEAFSTSDSF